MAMGKTNERAYWYGFVAIMMVFYFGAVNPSGVSQFIQDVGIFWMGDVIFLAFIVGMIGGCVFIFSVEWLWSFNWKFRKIDRIRHRVIELRKDTDAWNEEFEKHSQLIKDLANAKTKREKQDFALLKEESLERMRELQSDKCDKAQKELDKIFLDLGYEFPTLDSKEEEILEGYGAKND
jgi:hypothetical protein